MISTTDRGGGRTAVIRIADETALAALAERDGLVLVRHDLTGDLRAALEAHQPADDARPYGLPVFVMAFRPDGVGQVLQHLLDLAGRLPGLFRLPGRLLDEGVNLIVGLALGLVHRTAAAGRGVSHHAASMQGGRKCIPGRQRPLHWAHQAQDTPRRRTVMKTWVPGMGRLV